MGKSGDWSDAGAGCAGWDVPVCMVQVGCMQGTDTLLQGMHAKPSKGVVLKGRQCFIAFPRQSHNSATESATLSHTISLCHAHRKALSPQRLAAGHVAVVPEGECVVL